MSIPKEKLKLDILRLLRAKFSPEYQYLSQYFGRVDYSFLREIVRELKNQGLISYDQSAWEINQIAVKITPEGVTYIRMLDRNLNDYKNRTWLISVGVIGAISFLFLISLTFLGGPANQTGFKAEIAAESHEELIQDYLKTKYGNVENYEIKLVSMEAEEQKYWVTCRENQKCAFFSRYFFIRKKGETWKIIE